MFKIILADDEPAIINGLKKMIQWEKLKAEVVGEAQDGTELIEKIKELKPDIVISDVAMPGRSGIDVIREIRENGWKTKVIFLSGYQEFDYVKKAINYEAVEYLLKPAGQDELEQAILRAEKLLRADHPMGYWEEADETHFQTFEVDVTDKKFLGVCFAIPVEFQKRFSDRNQYELLRFSLFKRIEEYLKRNKNGFVIKRESNSSTIILLFDKYAKRREEEQAIFRIMDDIYTEYQISFIVGIGAEETQINELKQAARTAKFSCELYYFCRERFIWYQDISRDFTSAFEAYNKAYKEMLSILLLKDNWWIQKLNDVLDIIENLHYGNRFAAENRCIAFAMDFYRDLEEYKMFSREKHMEYEQFVLHIRDQGTYEELKGYIKQYLKILVQENMTKMSFTEKSEIRRVKEYIKEHFAEEIGLAVSAELVYMNPCYFSTFFKKQTGQNFKNYLVEIRMKEALKLLVESDMKTYELAKAVGYKDVRSFTEKFREIYGDSPAGYKRSCRGS